MWSIKLYQWIVWSLFCWFLFCFSRKHIIFYHLVDLHAYLWPFCQILTMLTCKHGNFKGIDWLIVFTNSRLVYIHDSMGWNFPRIENVFGCSFFVSQSISNYSERQKSVKKNSNNFWLQNEWVQHTKLKQVHNKFSNQTISIGYTFIQKTLVYGCATIVECFWI